MKQVDIPVIKTARYFQIGEFNEYTKHVIVACHGYAQLANYFLKWFEGAEVKDTVIIAPEGLSRFYWNGFSGNVVASWMTREDRDTDIKDYVNYLDEIVNSLNLLPTIKITAFGFSQGGSTVSRWIANTKLNISHLILWAGVFPEDVEITAINSKLESPIQVLFGNEDQFYPLSAIDSLEKKFEQLDLPIEFTRFEGQHKVYLEPLNKLLKKLNIA